MGLISQKTKKTKRLSLAKSFLLIVTMNTLDSVKNPNNKFTSFDEFKDFIRQSFINYSAIDPELFDACVTFHCDQEYSFGNDISTPIHDALNWDFKRFRQQANETIYAAFLSNEDGSVWQVIISLWDEERNKPYRYLAPKDSGDRAFLPPIPTGIRKKISDKYGIEVPLEGSFWEWIEDVDIPRIATEGGKKALCGLSHGYVTLALFGCRCGAKTETKNSTPYLIPDLERFATPQSRWLTAFDRDEKHKAKLSVAIGKKRLADALKANQAITADIIWRTEDGKGMDDVIAMQGSGVFDGSYLRAMDKLERSVDKEERGISNSRKKQLLQIINSRWSDLRFNEMTLKVELNGEPLEAETLSIRIAEELEIDIGQDVACQILLYLAKRRSYSPVKDYLNRVAEEYSQQDLSILDNLADRYFGTNEPLYNVFMRKHLLGQVQRVFEPGCQHDTVLVLQGAMGLQKSKFFRTLAVNPDWFDDSLACGNNDKDDRMKLRRFWMIELAELEGVFKKKEIPAFRGFITTKADGMRIPYGRTMESFPRTSCFVGTANPSQFLVDPEGHRRFWVIPVAVDFIDIQQLRQEVDRLWAAAVHAYRRGETNYLPREMEARNAQLNRRHEVEDAWQEYIEEYLEGKTQCTVREILTTCLQVEISRQDNHLKERVTRCLKHMGWQRSNATRREGGRSTPLWVKPDDTTSSSMQNLDVNLRLATRVGTSESTCNIEQESVSLDLNTGSANPIKKFSDSVIATDVRSSSITNSVSSDSVEESKKSDLNFDIHIRSETAQKKNYRVGTTSQNDTQSFTETEFSSANPRSEPEIKDLTLVQAEIKADTLPPEPELFLLGTGGQRNRKVDYESLVGKRVKVAALGGEICKVVAIAGTGSRPLICKYVAYPDRKPLYVALKDLE